MKTVNGRPCYCSIGAGGNPCIDRKYCDALREIERLKAAVDGLRQNRDLAYEKEKRLRAALEQRDELIRQRKYQALRDLLGLDGEAQRDD